MLLIYTAKIAGTSQQILLYFLLSFLTNEEIFQNITFLESTFPPKKDILLETRASGTAYIAAELQSELLNVITEANISN